MHSSVLNVPVSDAIAVTLMATITRGDVEALQRQLAEQPTLATARVVDTRGVSRTLLHVVADWPGHVPNGAQLVATLVGAGANVNAPVLHADVSGAPETPLHWAASNDDVAVLDALLDHGADIEAGGGALTGGSAMSSAVVFAQWRAARLLLKRGAITTLWQAAALGLVDEVRATCAQLPTPSAAQITNALWHACRGGQLAVAEVLVEYGADPNWVGHDRKTALDVARAGNANALVDWLLAHGAKSVSRL